ncbi:M23 family metallopeptidase [Herbiconiux sp. CPCC 205763]|uniref:M23 family metallopeptidase n=1 Tax=Herbiconiux aconitum TaxID=2970913 RepID=A0ABT2GV98_9MICO|nr:M23 family metallopeptidase [Herbiconiux aconitum]MCS5720146.1 M23 family metallopeptidase [Herbiconiux aconitum]
MDDASEAPGAVLLSLPFADLWRVENSPARRVPSHGVDVFGERYAIDFVGVDRRHRSATVSDWRTVLATEPPERFVSFGRPILAPADGTVVAVHDGEADHEARRSQAALLPYALGQAARLRAGVTAIAGNHVVLQLRESGSASESESRSGAGVFAALVHLRQGSLRVAPGDEVTVGQPLAACGNSGNSTQPHLHLQLMDSADLAVARGIPLAFRRFREWTHPDAPPTLRDAAIPAENTVVAPAPEH